MTYLTEVILFLSFVPLLKSQQVSLATNLQDENRNFYCDGERIVCNGTGLAIEWTAPPSIPSSQPEGFPFTATPLASSTFGDVMIILNQTTPFLMSTMILRNIPRVEVTCRTNNPGSVNSVSLIRAVRPDPPGSVSIMFYPGSDGSVSITVTWDAANTTGMFDFSNYRVLLDINETRLEYTPISNTLSLSTSLSGFVSITALVYVQTKCSGIDSDPGQGNLAAVIDRRIIVETRDNVATTIGLGTTFGIIFLVAFGCGIINIIMCYCWCKNGKARTTSSDSPEIDLKAAL